MDRFQPAKRLGGAVAIVLGVWLGVGVAPAASIDFLAHRADLPTMPKCGTGRELQNAASGLLNRVARSNPKPILARLHSPDPEVRASCALLAARNGTPGSLEPILTLTRDPNPRVRRCALHAVTYYRDPRIVPSSFVPSTIRTSGANSSLAPDWRI